MLYAAFMHLRLFLAYPPGTDLDVGYNGLEALKPLRYGIWPFYIVKMSSPDFLFIYLQTLSSFIFGERIIALRLPAVFSGWLGFAVLYATIKELGRGELDHVTRQRIGLLAVAALATSQVLAFMHRMGLRFSMATIFQMGAIWALSWAIRNDRPRQWIVAAVLAGMTQYTYSAARALPLLLLLVLLIQLSGKRGGLRSLWRGLLVYISVVLLLLLPQIVWYLEYPETFFARASQTGLNQHPLYATAGPAAAIWAKLQMYWEALGSYWLGQYNHIKEPLFAKLFYRGFILGIPLLLLGLRRRFVWIVLSGLIVMVLPEMIAGASDWPHETRLVGVYPFVAIIAGLGLGGGWSLLRRWSFANVLIGVALLASVTVTMYQEAREFFSLEANYSKLYWNQNWWLGRIEAGVGTLNPSSDESFLLPLEDYSRHVINYLTLNRANTVASAISAEGELLSSIPLNSEVNILLPHKSQEEAWQGDPTQWVLFHHEAAFILPPLIGASTFLPDINESTQIYGTGVEEIILLGHTKKIELNELGLADLYRPQYESHTCFEFGLCLTGVTYAAALHPGERLRLHLYWELQRRVQQDFVLFVHLLDPDGNAIGGVDDFPLEHAYRTYEWRLEETVLTTHDFVVPNSMRPGRYTFEVGMYTQPGIERVPAVNAEGALGDDRVLFSHLKIARPETTLPNDLIPTEIIFNDNLELVGYRIEEVPSANGMLALRIWWRAQESGSPDWTAFFHLTPATDNTQLVGQLDRTITGGSYPPSVWDSGELVEETVQIGIADIAAGEYELWMGLYSPYSQVRATVTSSTTTIEDNRTRLLQLQVHPDS